MELEIKSNQIISHRFAVSAILFSIVCTHIILIYSYPEDFYKRKLKPRKKYEIGNGI